MRTSAFISLILGSVSLLCIAVPARAQDNYEIQVYGSETMAPGATMFELHSNFTLDGRRRFEDGLFPTQHAEHETLEITHGLNPWSELGFYFFTSARSDQGFQYVGSHIRPRVRVPESWDWPVGLSLSAEVGFQRREFSTETWSLELRPIIDKQVGRWYASLNPTLERALRTDAGPNQFDFSPNAAVGFDVSYAVNIAAEYYGAYGPVGNFDPPSERQQQIFGAVNLNVSPAWEINIGYGLGLTNAGDRRLFKIILGRRVGGEAAAAKDKTGQ